MPTKLGADKIAAIVAKLELPMTDKSIMPFGKHVGKKLEQVPASYLLWFADQPWSYKYAKLVAYVAKNYDLLESQVQYGDEFITHGGDCDATEADIY